MTDRQGIIQTTVSEWEGNGPEDNTSYKGRPRAEPSDVLRAADMLSECHGETRRRLRNQKIAHDLSQMLLF